MIDSSSTNSIIQIPLLHFLWLVLISFICAFSKRLNDYASHPDEYHSFLLFISEVLLSGVCGVLIGALTDYLFKNIYLVTFSCGVGGILGTTSLKIAIGLLPIAKKAESVTKIDLEEINKELDKDKNITPKKKRRKRR